MKGLAYRVYRPASPVEIIRGPIVRCGAQHGK
jgi:hypothetical protein